MWQMMDGMTLEGACWLENACQIAEMALDSQYATAEDSHDHDLFARGYLEVLEYLVHDKGNGNISRGIANVNV